MSLVAVCAAYCCAGPHLCCVARLRLCLLRHSTHSSAWLTCIHSSLGLIAVFLTPMLLSTCGARLYCNHVDLSTARAPCRYLWSDMPRFEASTAPLADKDGQALQLPNSPWLDHALFLSDQQVRLPPPPTRPHTLPSSALILPPPHPTAPHPSPESCASNPDVTGPNSSSLSFCKGVAVLVRHDSLLT